MSDASLPLSGVHPAAWPVNELLKRCDVQRGRASGPGGQHRNKVETAIRITHRATGILGAASERRSQQENHRVAVFRLRVKLAVEHRGSVDLPGVPSALWRSRVRDGRIALNPTHADFPAMLAEAMDVLEAVAGDLAKAARLLDCTASQLIKLFKEEPQALANVNAARIRRQTHPLK